MIGCRLRAGSHRSRHLNDALSSIGDELEQMKRFPMPPLNTIALLVLIGLAAATLARLSVDRVVVIPVVVIRDSWEDEEAGGDDNYRETPIIVRDSRDGWRVTTRWNQAWAAVPTEAQSKTSREVGARARTKRHMTRMRPVSFQ